MSEYLHSIDETPKFVNSPTFGTTSIEHYVRILVTYLARLQSVTQSSAKGLTLRVYVKLDTKEWLRMYSRLYHACELTSCMHLPDPVMLTAATLVKDSDDLAGDIEEEKRNTAMRAIRSLRNELGLGGRPDAAPARSQTTMLAMDFDPMAQNKASRTTTTLGESLRDKGWNELRRISPQFSGTYTCQGTRETLCSMVQAVEEMNDIQKSTLTAHIHLSMQSVVVDNIVWPFSDVGCGVTLRLEAQQKLKATYVEPIIEIARMTARAPIININHDPRFVAAGSEEAKKVENNLTGFQAMGAYVALELRVRGCVVIHGSSFWSKMACQLKQSSTGIHMLSWETNGDGDEHVRLWKVFAIYEKQLLTEKMVTACLMDHNKIKEWDDTINAPVLN